MRGLKQGLKYENYGTTNRLSSDIENEMTHIGSRMVINYSLCVSINIGNHCIFGKIVNI